MAMLMTGVSGIRGVIGDGLTPDVIARYGAAYGTYIGGGKIVVGSDSRPSRHMVRSALFAGLMASGCDVIDLGLVTTPTIELMVEKLEASGGICVTASHNPISWNAMKFLDNRGRFLGVKAGGEVNGIFNENQAQLVETSLLGSVYEEKGAVDYHIQRVLDNNFVDVSAIRRGQFRVAIDAVNSVGNLIMPGLLHDLGCDIVKAHDDLTGQFGRGAEPLPENLSDLSQLVVDEGADIGFALDPDGDRLAVVDEQGRPIGEEYTLALAAKYVLEKKPGAVVCNLSTSRVIEDLAKSANVDFYRTPVGEAHVADKMDEVNAVIGGEGNGGVMLPSVHSGRDAMVGAALILSLLANEGEPVSIIHSRLPGYKMIKRRAIVDNYNFNVLLDALKAFYNNNATFNTTDGIRIDLDYSWVHVRPSNTEPIVRIYSEAKNKDDANILAEQTIKIIKNVFKN